MLHAFDIVVFFHDISVLRGYRITDWCFSGVHGSDGPMAVTECLFTSVTDHFIEAAKELGFKHTDNNGRDPTGLCTELGHILLIFYNC